MLTLSYICIGLSTFSILLIIHVIKNNEKEQRLRYHGFSKNRRKIVYKL